MARRSITKIPNQKVARWAISNCDSFMMVFTQNILHWAMHQPIAFSQLWSLMRWFKPVNVTPFLHFYTCTPVWVGHKWTLNL